jgi:hypothetical protein
MPNTEVDVRTELLRRGVICVDDVAARRTPLTSWPWKTDRSRVPPTSDIFLPANGVHVEVKGFMTIYAMAKIAWLCQQTFGYYVFQATEEDWDPFTDALDGPQAVPAASGVGRLRLNIARQAEELRFVCDNPTRATECGRVSRARIQRYVATRVAEYRDWAGTWP